MVRLLPLHEDDCVLVVQYRFNPTMVRLLLVVNSCLLC